MAIRANRLSLCTTLLLISNLLATSAPLEDGCPAKAPENTERRCPCSSADLCKPITKRHDWEVFGFSVRREGQYVGYDWEQLTTVAWNTDPELMCLAHSKGARVVLNADVTDAGWLGDAAKRAAWVQQQLDNAHADFMDGINFDLEIPLQPNSPEARAYTALVQETATAFHTAIPGSQISVDIPWSPHGIDGRHFDWQGLVDAADILFMMAYDMQSQIWGRCVASANTPLPLMLRGIDQWLSLGVPADKLVLGLPWYGYNYPCKNDAALFESKITGWLCALPPYDFRGCPCSDAVGQQKEYQEIRRKMGDILHGIWDEQQQSPFFSYLDNAQSRQVWYDNPRSLALKVRAAAANGLRGVGMWHLDCLDYRSDDDGIRHETRAMWAAMRHPSDLSSTAGSLA